MQYDAVGECLIAAIEETLGDAATAGIITAWTEAYGFLAETFVSIETEMKEKLSASAGFSGMVDMRVVSNSHDEEIEANIVAFVPVDNDVPPYTEGQFVSIDVVVDEEHSMTSTKLLVKDPAHVTVVVKDNKEKANVALAQAQVGDVLKVSMPCGKANVEKSA